MPNQAKGGVNTSLAMLARRIFTFQYLHKHIRPEFVDIIDDYFSMFGYSCHRVKAPNISARPSWNYIKTRGCSIRENIPALDAESISKIFDNGITFWKSGSYIGNYSLDNDPV